jgi:hypothetical protein
MVTIDFEQHKLSNGLDVILHEDHSIPLAAVNVWYHVGSKNEEAGRTKLWDTGEISQNRETPPLPDPPGENYYKHTGEA